MLSVLCFFKPVSVKIMKTANCRQQTGGKMQTAHQGEICGLQTADCRQTTF